ncbi:MAG: hypothetical protein HOL04_02620 [Gammaproteobacteria bacterium]|jgi:hypothetical protein|nr:hypothetical protein [Gammaproteobacteria bacterium]MBT4606079.1 hypothetical protein [Thiotrichales bacterium]MBT3471868.1 hypothetical protein [Gammaproteobacteria bacterium]MBT3967115.1 hypothetical protein [Gammaproteobacteria bacterium]MBT4082011.1 hypothetical protein [Gammaproteobacteria bacterium]
MSGDVYFVLIRGFKHKNKLKEVVDWLETNVVLGHGEAEQVETSLPFEIPMGFPSKDDAKQFVQKLELYGCIIEIESLSQRKERAQQATAEVAAAEPLVTKKREKPSKQKSEPKVSEGKKSIDLKKWVILVLIGVGVIAVALLGWSGLQKVDTDKLASSLSKVNTEILSMIQDQTNSGSPFSQVVGNMQQHIDSKNYSQEERVDHSNNYMGAVQGEKPVKNRETRNRNILIIQASIAFYKKNGKAWKRLVAEYRAIGATLKVQELRKEMVEVFGEEETAELLEEE